jgi:thymidylate synthase
MSVIANRARLEGLTKELMMHWRETKEYWRDAKSEEFENKYLSELKASVDKAVTVIEQLDKVVNRIKRDCE